MFRSKNKKISFGYYKGVASVTKSIGNAEELVGFMSLELS